MLLYIRDKSGVSKSWIIQALKIGFTFLNKQKKLIMSALANCSTDSIGKSTIYIALKINTRARKDFVFKANIL